MKRSVLVFGFALIVTVTFPPPVISKSVETREFSEQGEDLGPAAPIELLVIGSGVFVNVPSDTDAIAVGVFDEGSEEPCCLFGDNLPPEGWISEDCVPPCAAGKHTAAIIRTPAGIGNTTTAGVTTF
jgi:hypothetical protein